MSSACERPTQSSMRAVIFDLDGTLVDTIGDLAAAVNRSLAQRGYPRHAEDAYKLMVGEGFRKLVERAMPEPERSELRIDELLLECSAYYAEHCLDMTRPYPGIEELLAQLAGRGLPLAVLSNKPEAQTIKVALGLFPSIPFILLRGETPAFPRKPDPASALDCAKRLGTSPDSILYLGDSKVDMLTAKAAGMFGLGAAWGFRGEKELRESGARAILARPEELLDYL